MSSLKRRLLTGVAAGLVVSACGGTDITDPGSISLSLTTTSATVVQGGSQAVAATLTRAGGFTGTVNLTVTGSPLPTGVTPVVSNVVTTGSVTTATVTINVGAATATGIYALVVHGTGSGVTEATKTFTLTVTAAGSFTLGMTPAGGVTMVQGSTDARKTITITRTNYTPAIQLTAEGLPTGVTVAFAGDPVSGNSSVMTLTATAGAPVGGPVTVTIRGTGPASFRNPGEVANVEATTTISLTITAVAPVANFSLTTTPTASVSVTQGAPNTNVTVNINRTGGNTSNVALTFTGTLPAGMGVTFLPTSTTTNSSVLTVTTTGATPVGTTSIVIKGNATGLGEQTIGLDIIVTAPSGNVTLNFSTCPADERRANGWVAFQDGTAGVWTRATQAPADVYQFTITQSKGGIAWVGFGYWGSVVNVRYYTQAELTAFTGATLCPPDVPGTGRTVTGGAASITTGATTRYASYGGGTDSALVNAQQFTLTNVNNGSNDLVGFMQVSASPSSSTDRGFIDRGLNPVANPGSVGTVDFAPANPKSFPLQVATLNVGGSVGGETILQSGMTFYSGTGANACTRAPFGVPGQVTGTSFPASGVPIGSQVATDIHSIFINAFIAYSSRFVREDFKNLGTRAATPFVLPTLPVVTTTILAGPYKRLQATTTFHVELNGSATLGYSGSDIFQQVSLFASAAWIGGTALTLSTPDFSTTVGGGFDNTWAPGSSDLVSWYLNRSGNTGTVCTEGHRVVSAERNGTI